jgi:membrane AbrB-like protein
LDRLPGTSTRWLAVALATVAVAVAFGAIGLPTAALFAALVVGIAYALTLAGRGPLELPKAAMTGAQALVGVALGTSVDADTLSAVGAHWLPVLLVTLGTLVISLAAGLALARVTGVDRPTASLGLVAGGASGIVAMADELGADGRLVAFMQYLRVLVVVLTAPVLAHLLLHPSGAGGGVSGPGSEGLAIDLLFTAGCAVAGLVLARAVRLTAGALLAPLVVAAALSISGLSGDAVVPDLVQQVAFALIGLQVGLRFTMATMREMGRLLPVTLLSIVGMIVACAGLAALLVPLAHVSYGDAYLATTPGGLYAVLAATADIGGNVTFVVAVQALRVFVMVLAAPPLVRLLARGTVRPQPPTP